MTEVPTGRGEPPARQLASDLGADVVTAASQLGQAVQERPQPFVLGEQQRDAGQL